MAEQIYLYAWLIVKTMYALMAKHFWQGIWRKNDKGHQPTPTH